MKNKIFVVLVFLLLLSIPTVLAEDDGDDIEIFDLELEKLLNLGSGILALILCILTVLAYRRTNNAKLMWISSAFFLFAIKGFLTSTELFFEEFVWIDPTASVLQFAILIAFFIGVLKKK